MLTTLVMLVAVSQADGVPEAAPPPGAETHDGFFLRMTLGGGPTRATSEVAFFPGDDAVEFGARGRATNFNLEIGVAVTENLIVFGALNESIVEEPSVAIDEFDVDEDDIEGDVSMAYVGLGAGVSYYLPLNFYVSGALLVGRLVLETDELYGTDRGLGIFVSAGWEYFVSSNWGLGVAITAFGANLKDADDANGDPTIFRVRGGGLAFSATFN
jgi:hypothetical protein